MPSARQLAAATLTVAAAVAAVTGIVLNQNHPGPADARGMRSGDAVGVPGPPRVVGRASGSTPTRGTTATGPLVWGEEFDGAADQPANPAFWAASTGGQGFGNRELECNTDDRTNSALDGRGQLVISALSAPGYHCPDGVTNDYTSARLTTEALPGQVYGSVRVRAKLPSDTGMWPGIWALGKDNAHVGWPASGEIDIAEVIGHTPDTIYQTLHGPATSGGAYSLGGEYRLGTPADSGFHVYGLDWTADRITFSVDGDAYATFTKTQVQREGQWVFDKPFFLLLDLAVGGTFPGPPSGPDEFPQKMIVDYVRVYGPATADPTP